MTGEKRKEDQSLPGTGVLWLGWFIGIFAWAIHLFASYALVEWHCQNPEVIQMSTAKLILHLISLGTLGMAVYGIHLTWSLWHRHRGSAADTTRRRIVFMARGGFLVNMFMAVLILVEALANFIHPVCYV
jgi:hypothetical protein